MIVLSDRMIERSADKTVIDNNAVYWRDCFVAGILHEQLYILVCSAPYYPREYTTLFYDQDKYPAKQVIKTLQEKHGRHGDEKYLPPKQLRVDALDEFKPKNLEELYEHIETLKRRVDVRAITPNWERDFSRVRYHATCVDGDQAFFRTAAISALNENRCQVSSTAKNLLSKDDNALICFGLCVTALEGLNPYKSSGRSSHSEASEMSLGASYA
jgi:hypothetical protein